MRTPWAFIQENLSLKLITMAGTSLLLSVAALTYFAISRQEAMLMRYAVEEGNRLGTTIKLGTWYAMMINSRDDLHQITTNIGQQQDIRHLRIYNMVGRIKFANRRDEIETVTQISSPECQACHNVTPPRINAPLEDRTRIFRDADGHRQLGIISPILNEPGCESGCHYHQTKDTVLGAIDVVISLEGTDHEIESLRNRSIFFTLIILALTALSIFMYMRRFVIRPIRKLIRGAQTISDGGYCTRIDIDQPDEMGTLVHAIESMGKSINEKQIQLNRQRDEYQSLFSQVPCIITVQDRDFNLLRYNREFADTFQPMSGDKCYHAYKGRQDKCPNCPVEKTFASGKSYTSEESGLDASGSPRHWLVTSAPIRNDQGEVVAAMEMCLDITSRKRLEADLERSERKYQAIFRNIPNPVFVLLKDDLTILDCNESVWPVYGYEQDELIGESFLTLFAPEDRSRFEDQLTQKNLHDRVIHVTRDGQRLFMTVRISPSECNDQKVLLVTTSDMTQRLETEQQLIQASKMATLGEMATGMAHELNQPLTVIKASAGFLRRKTDRQEPIAADILSTLTEEIESHVDRASKIINHLREFGRKPEMKLEPVDVGAVLVRALDIFSQQLKLREISVVQDCPNGLPQVQADAGRLEQVFINMLINARDAIEDKWRDPASDTSGQAKTITMRTYLLDSFVIAEIEDSGSGIPAGVRSRIFEPFFTTKPVGKGTGLGLSISYGIIQDCGGTIRVESEPGQGTKFIISLPIFGETE